MENSVSKKPAQTKARAKYADRHAIEDKIRELFADRKLSDLVQLAKLEKDSSFISALIHIQFQIYRLDAYLESEWALDDAVLEKHWKEIDLALSSLVDDSGMRDKMILDVRKYQKMETDCRQGKWPTRIGFKTFYQTKSCDVRLIRQLIYQAAPLLRESWDEKAWTTYDMITEVYDDIHDLQEDLHSFNANRFLLMMLRKGHHQTEIRYRNFILQLDKRAVQQLQKNVQQESYRTLYHWTRARIEETRNALDQSMETADMDPLAESYLLQYMK